METSTRTARSCKPLRCRRRGTSILPMPGHTRYSIDLPDKLHRQVKLAAIRQRMSMRKLVLRWIDQGVRTDQTAGPVQGKMQDG